MGCEGMGWSQLTWDKVHKLGSCEHANELSGFTKGEEFVDQLHTC
jgi:hypothetical protein